MNKNKVLKINQVCNTDGHGLWSGESKPVKVTKAEITYYDGEGFGGLIAYFDSKTWDPKLDGLIYTDRLWMKEFQKALQGAGFSEKAAKDVDYSEQGMQGRDFVSMDIGGDFIKEWQQLVGPVEVS